MLGQLEGGYGSVEVPEQVEDPRIRQSASFAIHC